MCTYIHVENYIYIYMCVCMYDSVSMYVCMHTFMDGCLSMYVCLYVYGHTSAYLSADLSIFLCFRLIYTVAIADVYMCTPVSTIFISAYVRVIKRQ